MEINYKLFRHQIKAIEGCMLHPFRIVYRLPGTGKTLICAELVKRQFKIKSDSFILWLGPANLIEQYKNVFQNLNMTFEHFESAEHKISSGTCIFSSYEMFRLHLQDFLNVKWDSVICDEFHRVKSETTMINEAVKSLRNKSKHFWAFTGTPFQNSPYEFFELISIVAGKNLSFACERTLQYRSPKFSFFRNLFGMLGFRVKRLNQGPITGVAEPEILHNLISDYIDYVAPHDYIQECSLPVVSEQVKRVELTPEEIISYKNVFRSYRKHREKNFFTDNLADDQIERSFNNLTELRQNLLRMDGKISSKIITCTQDIKSALTESTSRILVFSNFVKYGLEQLAKSLEDNHVKFSLYDGSTSKQKRKEMLHSYFSGRIPVMLLSPVGFEGLDLYGTTHIFVLDPHFNPERTRQLISRAIRAFSGVKEIKVCHYIAVSEQLKPPCIDEIILNISERKKKLAEMIENCLS